ncbi:hypothetical protein [Ligilactobacillus salivarius]|uniref:hypothetical protein n=1 Tax=Ligilactobacillus salivarius TaxID=1624 RepID=UPI0022E44884|nr:hypothetical protein [Ligilactobacillus salivarius]
MKINFKNEETEDIFKVGNVFRHQDYLYLVVNDVNEGYALVCLNKNNLIGRYDTLEELAEDAKEDGDTLVYAEINVF